MSQIFIPRQERSTWKPVTYVPLIGFYSRAIQSCAFQEVSAKHTRGLGQSQTLRRAKGSMNGLYVTHGSGSKFLVSMSLGCASQIMLLGSSCSTFGTSLANKLFN